ncbi:MAG: hypothetical protein QOH51_3198 [Acidobacteriota bacterium]|jgi:hypothetical protein|nr:hypothetical protein [Acidobacteriota bacterium]
MGGLVLSRAGPLLYLPPLSKAFIGEQMSDTQLHFKDTILDRLSYEANVAQFVSFSPDFSLRYSRIQGYEPNSSFGSAEEAIGALFGRSGEGRVNVRSFLPDDPKSKTFRYDIRTVGEAVETARGFVSEGLFVIVNETIDVNDGGVSGVAFGDIIELAPGDTPRCVEKPGTASFSRDVGLRLLEKVYGFRPALDYDARTRVEFSLHPLRRGFLKDHTIIWELERMGESHAQADTRWPNRFSRLLGDKAFGLLLADTLGLPVPRTTVIARWLAPFNFGRETHTGEVWIRTCPFEQDPGHFTTQRGWCDPFKLLEREDPEGKYLASVLAQQGVDAAHSGSLVVEADGTVRIEGTSGYGDKFMVGVAAIEQLPEDVLASVRVRYEEARTRLGPVRMEWVHDRSGFTWVVQLHRGATTTQGWIIHKGEASLYHRFDVTLGIDELRALIARVRGKGEGIILLGHVGVTSHLGDLLRKAEIPSRIEYPESSTLTRGCSPLGPES